MHWFFRQVPLLWLFFTAVIIAAVLYSIFQAREMNSNAPPGPLRRSLWVLPRILFERSRPHGGRCA
jgi:hypothetical protein